MLFTICSCFIDFSYHRFTDRIIIFSPISKQVNKFEATITKPSEITFSWSLPSEEQNGILLGYRIKYQVKVRIQYLILGGGILIEKKEYMYVSFPVAKSFFFHIYMVFVFQGSEVAHETQFAADEVSGLIRNLTPGETYIFQIEAMTKVGSGPIRSLEKTMPIGGKIFLL